MPGPGNVLGAGEGGDIAMAVDHPRLALLLLRVTGQDPRQRQFGCRAALQQAQTIIGQVGIEPGLGSKGSHPRQGMAGQLAYRLGGGGGGDTDLPGSRAQRCDGKGHGFSRVLLSTNGTGERDSGSLARLRFRRTDQLLFSRALPPRSNSRHTGVTTMTKPLQDQIIMVTGASSGIGAATITTLLNAGARVVALARRIERLEQMQTSLEAGSDRLLPLCFTLTRPGRVSLNEIVVRPTRQPI